MAPQRPAGITHPRVRAARRLRRRTERTATGRLLVEGPNAVDEARDHLIEVFATLPASDRVQVTVDECAAAGVPVVHVDDRALEALADAQTPQGVVGVAVRPPAELAQLADATLLVVLDGVSDPGNLGTIVRTADAAGADGVVLTAGAVDPTNAKAVRSSAGSLFHLPVVDGVTPATLGVFCRDHGIRLIGTVADATTRYDDLSWDPPSAIVFGNEAHGLSTAVSTLVTEVVSVPIQRMPRRGYRGHAESLNLATTTAIVTFEIARQRRDRPTLDR